MWLVPYRFVQRVSSDVDYRIMGTFVEFYATLLGFVNFRLYTSIGLVYPPRFDVKSDERGGELAAFTLEGKRIGADTIAEEQPRTLTNGEDLKENAADIQSKIDAVAHVEEPQNGEKEEQGAEASDTIDKFEATAPEADSLVQPEIGGDEAGSLFAPFTFYISREAPRHPIEFLLRAFGCRRIGWDEFLGQGAFTHDESDPRITHEVVDRPPLPESAIPPIENGESKAHGKIRPGMRIPGRTYIQPQWVWDCINEGRLLRPDLSAPGAILPPHLSPWIKATKGQYDPRTPLAEQEGEGEAEMEDDVADDVEEEESEEDVSASGEHEDLSDEASVDSGMDVAGTDDEDEEDEEVESEDDGFTGFDEEEAEISDEELEDTRTQHQKELEAEAAGLPFSGSNDAKSSSEKISSEAKKRAKKQRQEEQELDRQKIMMPRKKRKLFEKMQYSNSKRDAESAKLRAKRRKMEKTKA